MAGVVADLQQRERESLQRDVVTSWERFSRDGMLMLQLDVETDPLGVSAEAFGGIGALAGSIGIEARGGRGVGLVEQWAELRRERARRLDQ